MREWRTYGMLGLFIGAQVIALALSLSFRSEGLQATSNPNSLLYPLIYLSAVVVGSVVIILLARRQGTLAGLRILLLLAISASLYLTLGATLSLFLPTNILLWPASAGQYVDLALPIAAMISVTLFLALLMEPQWYIVDLVGFLAAGGLIAIFGISLGILPALVMLAAFAVYDAIAVYGTKHMISLADVATDMKLPILMVMPADSGYDYPSAPSFSAQRGAPLEERSAMFMGLGDVVIPGVLIVSAFVWLPSMASALGVPSNLWVAIGTLAGAVAGYFVLMRLVERGNAQAGLPLLNGGAIAGYLIAYLIVYQNFSFGIGSAF